MKALRPAYAITFALAILAAVQAQASGSMPPSVHRGGDASAACESARLSAWFERQLQLTDGDVDPRKSAAVPEACMHTSDDGMAREQQAAVDRERASAPASKSMRNGLRSRARSAHVSPQPAGLTNVSFPP